MLSMPTGEGSGVTRRTGSASKRNQNNNIVHRTQ